MKSFRQYVEERGIEMPEGNIPGSWFSEHGYPMVVRCACCDMSMVVVGAYIDDEGYTLCSSCVRDIEGDEE